MNELSVVLKKQQSVFTHRREISDTAVRASYLVANEIAVASKPFSEGEFVKTCMLTAEEIVCPEKHQVFANISLTRNTVADRISDVSADLSTQLKHKVKSFIAFSVAVGESEDITHVVQQAIFICGVDDNFTVPEEFVKLVSIMDTTTATTLIGVLDRIRVDWSHTVHSQ